jgi:UTP--glucose-1-phosphate uridylyltransferase
MEIIINNKTLNNGLNVIQLETAVGSAMKTFDGGLGKNTVYFSYSYYVLLFTN